MGPQSKYDIHYVSYSPYTHSLKIMLYNILNNFFAFCVICCLRSGVEFSICGVISALSVTVFGIFWILEFWIRGAEPVDETELFLYSVSAVSNREA